ncbi:hypothetical protein C0W35_21615, partial [Photobacterium kishitanii]|uniref:hypothetical protein n=1 Tax=Photobacterium kishitanii TaxID=318456 RepID=UPI000D4FDEBE
MIKIIIFVFVFVFFSQNFFITNACENKDYVEKIIFKTNLIIINIKNRDEQKIESDIDPENLDYKYKLIDVNFDNYKDLLIYDNNKKNSIITSYL